MLFLNTWTDYSQWKQLFYFILRGFNDIFNKKATAYDRQEKFFWIELGYKRFSSWSSNQASDITVTAGQFSQLTALKYNL